MFSGTFHGKKVLVTGASGFKGTWLSMWLLRLGATVTGYSLDVPSDPSLFRSTKISERIDHVFGDVCDKTRLETVVQSVKPDYIFHLAAQPIVSVSYKEPHNTFQSNVMGTVVLLDCLRKITWPCVAILVTSDKCYENVEWVWGYRENDKLGGKDIYSASKAAAEIAISGFFRTYFNTEDTPVRFASVRAGNVVGGGDWAEDRVVVDCIKSWIKKEPVTIRSPNATRPWQHVLEPLSGYLWLAAKLKESNKLSGESFNFGPAFDGDKTVLKVIDDLRRYWTGDELDHHYVIQNEIIFDEATLLRLNCDKSLSFLEWSATLAYEECIELVGTWYNSICLLGSDAFTVSNEHIDYYVSQASKASKIWINN